MAKRPPIALNPSIPLVIQRAIRSVSDFAFSAQDKANTALTGLDNKVSKTLEDYLKVSEFTSKQIQAGGQFPISLTGLNGRAQQSQYAYVPPVTELPLRPNPLTDNGQLVWVNNQLYRFNSAGGNTGSLVNPGVWQQVSGSFLFDLRKRRQDHTTFPQYDPANLGVGTVFYETDSGLLYMVQPDQIVFGHPNQWFYIEGVASMYWPNRDSPGGIAGQWVGSNAAWDYTDANALLLVSDRAPGGQAFTGALTYQVQFTSGTPGPTAVYDSYYQAGEYIQDLGIILPQSVPSSPASSLFPFDKGFRCNCPGAGHIWQYLVGGWEYIDSSGSGWSTFADTAPDPVGWFISVPAGGGSVTVSASSGGTTTRTYGAWVSPVTGAGLYVRY